MSCIGHKYQFSLQLIEIKIKRKDLHLYFTRKILVSFEFEN